MKVMPVSKRYDPASFPQPVGSLGKRPDPIKAFARREIKRLLAGAGEGRVGGLPPGLDDIGIRKIAVQLGVATGTVQRVKAEMAVTKERLLLRRFKFEVQQGSIDGMAE
jgi:hypothetical protein